MDSVNLFDVNRINIEYNKNQKITTKILKCLKCIDLKLVVLLSILITNLYLIYLLRFTNNSHRILSGAFISKNSNDYNSNKVNKVDSIIKESLANQKQFCDNPHNYLNQQYEDMIKLTDFSFNNIYYKLYVYKEGDNHISHFILRTKGYDINEMTNFYNVLEYYGKTKKILNKKDIYMLDLGANLGVYPSYFGRLGYTVISFEASPRNYYLIKKNICQINRNNENIIIINSGISDQEKICNYYTQITGLGNGMIKCDENRTKFFNAGFNWQKTFEVPIIKLSDFIPYLSMKNLALIKLDIEGSESLVMHDAIEFITKYHIPYIFSEYNKEMITEHGNNPIEYIKLFIDNGYKVNKEGFFSHNFIQPEKVENGNLYFTYYGN